MYHTLLLGDWAKGADNAVLREATRPSDFIISHLKAYAAFDSSRNWQAVIDASYNVIKEIRDSQNAAGNTNGLLPDFACAYSAGDLEKFGPLHLDAAAFDYTDPNLFAVPFLITAEAAGADKE